MSFRKFSRFAIPILIVALFWQPLSLAVIGTIARFYLDLKKECRLNYSSLKWTKQGIAITDLAVDTKNFSLKAPQAIVSLRNKRIEVFQPHLFLSQLPDWKGGDWTFSLQDGIIEGKEIDTAHFSFASPQMSNPGHLSLDWEQGAVAVVIRPEEEKIVLEVEIHQMDPHHLRHWTGDQWTGKFDGNLHLVRQGETWQISKGHIEGKEVSFDNFCEGVEGTIDWSCPLGKNALQEGHLRLVLETGNLHLERSECKEIHGELSYLGDAGSKWEFYGILNHENWLWDGRIFFQSLQEKWIETTIRSGKSTIVASGKGVGENRRWEVEWNAICPSFVLWLQDLAQLYEPRFSEWTFSEGILNGLVTFTEQEGKISNWEILKFSAENLYIQGSILSFGCEKVELSEKAYFLQGGAFSLSLPNQKCFTGKDWKGDGTLSKEFPLFSGMIEGCETSLSFRGGLEAFQGSAALKGPWNGELFFEGGWDSKVLHFLISDANLENFRFNAKGSLDRNFHLICQSDHFFGPLDPVLKILGKDLPFRGQIEGIGSGFSMAGSISELDWAIEARLKEGQISLFSTAQLENVEMEFDADPKGLSCRNVKGIFSWEKKLPFYCPILETNGVFDVRLEGELWDFARIVGKVHEGQIRLDTAKSHLLNVPISLGSCVIAEGQLQSLNLLCRLPWEGFATLFQIPEYLKSEMIAGGASFQISFEQGHGAEIEVQGVDLQWDHQPLELLCRFKKADAHWKIEPSRIGDFALEGLFSFDGESLYLKEGKGKWREGFETFCEGRFDSLKKWSINLSSIRLSLNEISSLTSPFGWPLEKLEGTLTGSGVLSWNEKLESDFDFTVSHLKAGTLTLENQTPLHLYYSSEKGIFFRGLDLSIMKPNHPLPWLDCKIGLLQYDVEKSLWVLTHSHFHLPSDFFPMLPQELDFIADIECASDFSTLYCSMKEGFIPFKGEMQHLQNVHLFFDSEICTANFDLFYQEELLKIGLFVNLKPKIAGRISIQDSLFIDWIYQDQFLIQAIEGTFAGTELSFHREAEKTLIGSARIDCNHLSQMVPSRIAKVFRDLKMGKGYELMGRFKIQEEGFSFSGILSGKQLELFNYQLRTLLAQLEITPSQVKISNLKISDSAGVMKIDEIIAKVEPGAPWTISIPHLTISEFRPSLIQKIGKPPGTISPLVIRQLKIDDFKGLLDESHTYTAKGELYFINSYKREHTVFEIPSDVLSRIVGLDLDLLIPVCGVLKYELENGFFHLTELKDAYSENKRSEFFLVNSDFSPKMDLDGNLNILIKMKQFVLFKFTESFLISIEGKLEDPKFHLQKKNRFLGL